MISSLRFGRLVTAVLASLLALVLSACSGQAQKVQSGGGNADDNHVTIGYVAWDECVASSYLWKELLERQGVTVKLSQLEPAALYAGIAKGNVDLFMCGVPKTHADYWARYGKDFRPIAQWYDTMVMGLAVPDYVDAQSVTDLKGRGKEFGGKIIGIESGAGLMKALHEKAEKDYDLSGYDVVDGSTPAMLAALDKAIKAKDPIVVTLWEPHWAFESYPVRLLEDPKKSFGDNDTYKVIGSTQAQQKTKVIEQISKFHMTPDQLQSLELDIQKVGTGHEQDAVRAWIGKNQAVVKGWTG